MIAVILDDIGLDIKHSYDAIGLDAHLTLSFLPYGERLDDMIQQARQNGHEIMLHLPMEPLSKGINPGPNALLTSLSTQQNLDRLDWNLKRMQHYVGVNNHMGSKFTSNADKIKPILQAIQQQGLLFLDSVTIKDSKAYRIARNLNMPYAVRDVFIDHDINQQAIDGQLDLVENTAKRNGFAVAIGHPHALTLKALKQWLPQIKKKGMLIVPISHIVKRQQRL